MPFRATLIASNPSVTMTSLELVDFINNQREAGEAVLAHSDFLKKVPIVLGQEVAGKFSCYYKASNGKSNPMYSLPKREACLMAMSYSYDLQAKVFDKMTELESKQQSAPMIPQTLSEALRMTESGVIQLPPMGEVKVQQLVGAAGFEPATLCPQGRCATRLRYAPTRLNSTPMLYVLCCLDNLLRRGCHAILRLLDYFIPCVHELYCC